MTLAAGMLAVDHPPAHALLGHAIVVLLPLAALCSVGLALHSGLRRRFGWPVVALAAVAVGGVLLTQATGRGLMARLPLRDRLIEQHVVMGGHLLPYALGFGVAVIVLLVAGRLADRERAASREQGSRGDDVGADHTGSPLTVSTAWRRISVLASALVIGTAVATTWQVVGIGISAPVVSVDQSAR